MSNYKGENILEVWDYRLSTASPLIRREKTWTVEIWSNNNPDYDPSKPETLAEPLEVYDTGIPKIKGDGQDPEKLAVCYEWLRSVRDNYSHKDIDKLKPLVADINKAIARLSAALAGKSSPLAAILDHATASMDETGSDE